MVAAETSLQQPEQNTENNFLVFSGILLIQIHIGLVCMEASRARLNYALNIFFKIFLHLFVSSTVYWLYGYGLAFSDGNVFMGLKWWNNVINDQPEMPPDWFYNYLVAAIPVTILSGTMSEFYNPCAFIINSIVITGMVQPIAVHWTWSNEGWLRRLGYSDATGAGVVFAFAGGASFAVSLLVPKRNYEVFTIYSAPLFSIGAAATVSGFLVLNCGALYRLPNYKDGGELVNQVIQNTIISGSGGCSVSLIIGKISQIKRTKCLETIVITVYGSLAGMVAVSGGVHNYTTLEAFIVGFLGAIVYALFHFLFCYLEVNDPADGFPIYFGAGLWGALAVNIFTKQSLIPTDNVNSCLWKILVSVTGTVAITMWSILWTTVLFLVLKICRVLKKDEKCELKDLELNRNPQQEEICYIEALPYLIREKTTSDGGINSFVDLNVVYKNKESPTVVKYLY